MSFGVPISPIIRRLRGHATNINSVDCDCYDDKPSVWETSVFFLLVVALPTAARHGRSQ